MRTKKVMLAVVASLLVSVLFVIVADVLYIKYAGSKVSVPTIPREPRSLGNGQPLTLAILGDSRTVSQGGNYEQGIAVSAAIHLAGSRQVTMYNFGVSGARTRDVLDSQVPQVTKVKPDLVVVLIGANDVTHRTSHKAVRSDMEAIVESLIVANCNTKIVLTDSGAMWTVPRIPHPLRYFAGLSAKDISADFSKIAANNNLTFAPVGAMTGKAFIDDHTNFAADMFHPSDKGYAALSRALVPYLDQALETQPSHCSQPLSR